MGRAQKISRGELYLRSTGEYLTNAGDLSIRRRGRKVEIAHTAQRKAGT